ncbi:MAG: NAD(+) synthase [Kiritimatiellae bacterium]|nr:NAD(+) synthase [Kiritimatiellia bacterium]
MRRKRNEMDIAERFWQTDAAEKVRPGAFDENAALLLSLVKDAARAGEREIVAPADFIRGGDCGSLNDHPAFQCALAAAQEKFLKAAAKVRNAPKVRFARIALDPPPISCAGPDPRFPFCGRPADVFSRQVRGLARRLAAIGCRDAVVGLSGGLDSALALLVTVAAFDRLGFDRRGVHVFTMPGFGTTRRTRGNAEYLAEGLGLALETIDITPACRLHFKDIGQSERVRDVTYENAQARERTQILMDKANQAGGIVVGTGDMSEIALGWCTYNGDHMSMFGANAGVPKTVVREVCRWWAEDEGRAGTLVARALLDIVATPVSPELLPSKRDEIAQKTEDKVGPYELHDFFLWHFIAGQSGRAEILKAAKAAFRGQYAAGEISKWLDVFFRRFIAQSFKRNCAPDGVQVFSVYLAPGAWHVPSDISPSFLRPRARA